MTKISRKGVSSLMAIFLCVIISVSLFFFNLKTDGVHSQRVAQISKMNGLIAFWDFSHMKNGKWTSFYDEDIVDVSYEIELRRIGDHRSYKPSNWPYKDTESKLMFDSSGPLGHAVRFNQGFIYGEVPRSDFDQSPLNIHGNRPFTLVAWCKFVGKRHFVAGIWDEGGWDKYGGRRQIALFGGLFDSKGVIAHVSATGASSYPQSTIAGSQYARMRAIDGQDFKNGQWVAMAMTFDPKTNKVTAYLNGDMTQTHVTDPVANDVYQYTQPVSSNPFYFPWPIFSPRSFVLKFNGYDFQSTGVYEHWLEIDTESFTIKYGQNGNKDLTKNQKYKVQFDLQREGKSVLSSPLEFLAKNGKIIHGPKSIIIQTDDIIITSLQRLENGTWQQIGSTIHYQIQEGAPFTFGRALGLGNKSIDKGSQLFIDGVAIFNRVLSKNELETLNFNL